MLTDKHKDGHTDGQTLSRGRIEKVLIAPCRLPPLVYRVFFCPELEALRKDDDDDYDDDDNDDDDDDDDDDDTDD